MKTTKETWLNQGTKRLTADEMTVMVDDKDVKVIGFLSHNKATEVYVVVSIFSEAEWREWSIPYVYRWHNLYIDTISGVVNHVKTCKPLLTVANITVYKDKTRRLIKSLLGSKSDVTTPIFRKLLKNCGEWVHSKAFQKFGNDNSAKRIQDLKQKGFTIITKSEGRKTYRMLLPFDIEKAPTYETIPAKVRKAIFAALNNKDAYNDKPAGRSSLPDHKFPEIRWDPDTPESNEGLSEMEMRKKFQLVPEAINQAKREVCRGCFRSGKRGKFNGIDFFYEGGEVWPQGAPQIGKEAEVGCVGCFWYDMTAWRNALNKLIKESQ